MVVDGVAAKESPVIAPAEEEVAPSPSEMQALHSFGFVPQCSSKMLKLVRWIPPLHDFSLNVDGACKGNPGDCGGGGCIRDSQGNVHLAFAHFYGVGTSMLAETRALSDGLLFASALGYRVSIVYSDSQSKCNIDYYVIFLH
ncbi:hypothetical protein Taro_032743 [Colocasia esculenta]|uniref:RNase H type-1 domain-containing protein n=1 Tax=Colocasia esculenta TaxID=4460 RepID=A0A843W2R5_COLES|nr:hypothetical protein [Colocasia esculenta]